MSSPISAQCYWVRKQKFQHPQPVNSTEIGYVQHIDMERLQEIAKGCDTILYSLALPGTFVDTRRPLAHIASVDEAVHSAVRNCYTLATERSFDQDPRFGMSVLAEIAQRALSPAVNDPGTAIDVIGRSVRLLAIWNEPTDRDAVQYPNVRMQSVKLGELFDDILSPIARNSASLVEVHVRLQKAMAALAALPDPRFSIEAARHSRLALLRSTPAMSLDEDKQAIDQAAAEVARYA